MPKTLSVGGQINSRRYQASPETPGRETFQPPARVCCCQAAESGGGSAESLRMNSAGGKRSGSSPEFAASGSSKGRLNKPHPASFIDGLPSRVHCQFLIDFLHMRCHGMLRNAEQPGDLAEIEPLGNHCKHFRFARGEAGVLSQRWGRYLLRRGSGWLEPLEQLPGNDWTDGRAAGGEVLDEADELFRQAVLENVAR